MSKEFKDVQAFQEKFGIPMNDRPGFIDQEFIKFRLLFLCEELRETTQAAQDNDLEGIADGLVDLVYVAMGTAAIMGLPWDALWDEVQRANMAKMKAMSSEDQGHREAWQYDVVKPEGWTPPRIKEILEKAKEDK